MTAQGFTATVSGSWTGLTLEANVTSTGSPYAATAARSEPLYGTVRLRGALSIGASFNADATLATLPVGLRPAAKVSSPIRLPAPTSANSIVDISTAGAISVRNALGNGAVVHLDGLTFERA